MQSIANVFLSSSAWLAISFAALLAFAFGADYSAKRLGMTIIDSTKDAGQKTFSPVDMIKLILVISLTLALLYLLKRLDFWVTAALIFALCAYIWLTGYRSKIEVLMRAGLPTFQSIVLTSLFTVAASSLFVGLTISAWNKYGAP